MWGGGRSEIDSTERYGACNVGTGMWHVASIGYIIWVNGSTDDTTMAPTTFRHELVRIMRSLFQETSRPNSTSNSRDEAYFNRSSSRKCLRGGQCPSVGILGLIDEWKVCGVWKMLLFSNWECQTDDVHIRRRWWLVDWAACEEIWTSWGDVVGV